MVGPTKHQVRIDGSGKPDKEVVHCSRGNKDEVEWSSDGPMCLIHFDGGDSPFPNANFTVSPGKPASSGPVLSSATVGQSYRYRINTGAGSMDPEVFIDR